MRALVNDICSATTEQSAGVGQVGEAVVHIDLATQENAALVEEMAAAAEALRTQPRALLGNVSVFLLASGLEDGSAMPAVHIAPGAPAGIAPKRLREGRRCPASNPSRQATPIAG
jgi:hypothetical protein